MALCDLTQSDCGPASYWTKSRNTVKCGSLYNIFQRAHFLCSSSKLTLSSAFKCLLIFWFWSLGGNESVRLLCFKLRWILETIAKDRNTSPEGAQRQLLYFPHVYPNYTESKTKKTKWAISYTDSQSLTLLWISTQQPALTVPLCLLLFVVFPLGGLQQVVPAWRKPQLWSSFKLTKRPTVGF